MKLIEQIKLRITEEMMAERGWKREDNPLEFEIDNPDSQMNMIHEDTDFIVDSLLKHLSSIEDPNVSFEDEVEEEEEESLFDEYGHLKRKQTNTTTSALFIFMDAGTGKPRYVSDVREWLKRIDTAGIPDDTEVEGFLHLSYDLDLQNAEKMECLECGNKEDILLTAHKCGGHNA